MRSKRGKNKSSRGAAAHIIIGNQLRHYYQGVVEQPIPDRFVRLLSELGEVARRSSAVFGTSRTSARTAISPWIWLIEGWLSRLA